MFALAIKTLRGGQLMSKAKLKALELLQKEHTHGIFPVQIKRLDWKKNGEWESSELMLKNEKLVLRILKPFKINPHWRTYLADVRHYKGPNPIHSEVCNQLAKSGEWEKWVLYGKTKRQRTYGQCPCYQDEYRGTDVITMARQIVRSVGAESSDLMGRGGEVRQNIQRATEKIKEKMERRKN